MAEKMIEAKITFMIAIGLAFFIVGWVGFLSHRVDVLDAEVTNIKAAIAEK